MRERDTEDVIALLHPKLKDYLLSQGVPINSASFFSCIHPAHPDAHPSCSLNKGNPEYEDRVFHCFSGGHSGNIFTAAHWLEQLPIQGDEFWTVTIAELCKRFDIAYKPIEISPDKRMKYQALRAHKDATNVITSMAWDSGELCIDHPGIKHLIDRGITIDSIRRFNIGIVSSFEEYKKRMYDLGWTSEEYLQSISLLRKSIFRRDGFILPIYNMKNQPVAFVTRNTSYDPVTREGEKYYNSVNSNIYCKGEILYNYNNIVNSPGSLYIVEGYLDAIYLQQSGIPKVAAIGAVYLTEKHVDMLYNNETDINLAFDGDEGGLAGVTKALEIMSPIRKFNIRIVDIPHGSDPDSYARESGINKFLTLDTVSPFAWTLSKTDYSGDLTTAAKNAVPTIAAENSAISRLKMIKELSNYTSVPETIITKDVEAILKRGQDEYLTDMDNLRQFINASFNRRKLADTKNIISEAMSKMDVIEERHYNTVDSKNDYLKNLRRLEDRIKIGHYKRGLLCPGFPLLDRTLDGIPYWANLIFMAGRASSGKTAFVTALALDLIKANEDLAVFFMSIDDNSDLLGLKQLAVLSGMSTTEIKQYEHLSIKQRDKFQESIDYLKSISNRHIVADASQGNTLDSLEMHVKYLCREFPDHRKLFILDNFHKLKLSVRGQNQRSDAISEACTRLKNITQINDIPIIATVELRKLDNETDRPTRHALSGSNKLDYDPDIIGLVHCDQQVHKSIGLDSKIVHSMTVNETTRVMPWVEINIVKNKINGNQGTVPLLFNDHNMQLTQGKYSDWTGLLANSKKNRVKNF